ANKYILMLEANPAEAVINLVGEGIYNAGQKVRLNLIPNSGYTFLGWFVKGQETPISTNAGYMLTIDESLAENQRINLVARFVSITTATYNVELKADPSEAVKALTGAGIYTEGENVSLSFTANEGYTFLGWYKEGANEPIFTDAEYTFTVTESLAVGYKITLIAKFTPPPSKKYTVELKADPTTAVKTFTGAGIYEEGAKATISFTANEGYTFLGWYKEGESEPIFTDAEYSFTVTESLAVGNKITLIAKFTPPPSKYAVELKAEPSTAVKAFIGAGIYTEGENATINIVPNEGYTFLGWYKEGASESIFTEAEYTFTVTESLAVGNKITLIAKFTPPPSKYTVELKADPTTAVKTFTGAGIYDEGAKAAINFTANEGYTFLGWYKEGTSEPISTSAECTFTVTESLAVGNKITLIAKFSVTPLKKYIVELKADPKEAANTIIGAQEYTEGEEARVVVIPNSGYKFLG
ncbi:MAG: InlB B-repeat-containing protein, partial [Bacteroidales bacterium]